MSPSEPLSSQPDLPFAPRILDGKAMAAAWREEIASSVRSLGLKPGLAVVLVGDDPASKVYVGSKEKAATGAGFHSVVDRLPGDTTQDELLARVRKLNADASIHGILVQLPLPAHIDESAVVHAIDPAKDVDGFHPFNMGLLLQGTPRFISATPRGIVEMLERADITTSGKRVVVVGRSNIVGKPMAAALLMKGRDATVTVAHSRTRELASVTRQADILIAAVGVRHLITAEHVRDGAVVIDVGMHRTEAGLTGDVDFATVAPKCSAMTPVPGGVGPMTIAGLLSNTLDAARQAASHAAD